jgi:uncharacterized protein (DUF342 family)
MKDEPDLPTGTKQSKLCNAEILSACLSVINITVLLASAAIAGISINEYLKKTKGKDKKSKSQMDGIDGIPELPNQIEEFKRLFEKSRVSVKRLFDFLNTFETDLDKKELSFKELKVSIPGNQYYVLVSLKNEIEKVINQLSEIKEAWEVILSELKIKTVSFTGKASLTGIVDSLMHNWKYMDLGNFVEKLKDFNKQFRALIEASPFFNHIPEK